MSNDRNLERAAKVAQVIAENPGLPIKVLAPSTPCDYDTYWHDATGARTAWLLYPDNAQGTDLRDYCGLESERVYDEEWEAAEDVAEWLFEGWYDFALRQGMTNATLGLYESNDERLTAFIGSDASYTAYDLAENVAWKMVKGMPWQKCVVIDCY